MFGFGLKESFSLEIESIHKHENMKTFCCYSVIVRLP